MTRRFQLNLTDEQYEFLDDEADSSSVPVAELIRRAIDTTYGLADGRRFLVVEHARGRRTGRRLDRAPFVAAPDDWLSRPPSR
jgi:hypothetical protein